MSFFGFEHNDLEKEKQKFLDGGLQESEDVAVYTWGEESYDGLGDALQEGGDELNDETFGGSGAVGKDFDFTNPALHGAEHTPASQVPVSGPVQHTQPPRSLEAIWDDKSPFSVLARSNGSGRSTGRASPSVKQSPYSGGESPAISHAHGIKQAGARTLQEIEAEMLAAAQHSRGTTQRQQQLRLQLQQQQEQENLLLQQQQEQQEFQRQRLIYEQQEHQHQLQIQRLLQQQQLQQQREQQHQRTPPPRMLPTSQSPRFLEHQRQILLMQQQQEQQQQQRLQELQEQLRVEELERRMAAQRLRTRSDLQHGTDNHLDQLTIQELQQQDLIQQQLIQQQLRQAQYRQRSQSPAIGNAHYPVPLQESLSHLPQNIHMQQRLLSELAQAEFIRDLQGASQADQEALRMEAMRKIVEAEKMEEKRRRKAAKIAHMARYNDLMTQSDKDFITRIQVSQLVTQDPYAEDFYAQVYGAILRSRLGLQSQDERVLKFGSGGGVGLGLAQKGGNRRPSAMQRMEQQVERIVSNARRREEEKGLHSLHSLQGALGKTSGRSYKAAPRQLLQVDATNAGSSPTLSHAHAHISKEHPNEGAAKEAAKLGREALGNAADTDNLVRKEPLTHRQTLIKLELLYDVVLKVEQVRRDQPHPDDDEQFADEWQKEYDVVVDELWEGLMVMVPLETSDPHPFVSLLTPSKGKKILPRLARHMNSQRMLTMLTLLVACFNQLDVVRQAPILDSLEDSTERADADRQTQAFLGSVLQSILPVVAKANLRLVTGLLGLLLDRSDIVAVTRTRPGLALLTLFLSRVEVIKQSMSSATDVSDLPSAEEAQQWQLMFDHLFQFLTPHFLSLFPSVRIAPAVPSGAAAPTDIVDQPVWQFLAALALHAVTEQHQILVTALREKVLENVLSANQGWVADEDERQTKLANVNLFLHALGLDSSQISM